jgi:nucleoid-associated protein YgaU
MLEAGIQPSFPTVRVERNDTLRKIAMRVYGNQDRWKDLYEANRNVLKRPEDVRSGQVLVIPE